MTFQLRPAIRENTPLIVGLAGPTKSGKTKSAHRLAQGLVAEMGGGPVVMMNAEGARGHQYADQYPYIACDIEKPFSYKRYTEALGVVRASNPGCVIVDSMSHAHDGPGGMLEQHDAILDRMAGDKKGKARESYTWAAWVEPKADENEFIYDLLGLKCPVILCFRAKEKIKLERVKGENGQMKTEVVDLGWQPIASDRIAFETLFTLLLPPHCKGVPDLSLSEMREPFDTLVPPGEPISEALGRELAKWSRGGGVAGIRPGITAAAVEHARSMSGTPAGPTISVDQQTVLADALAEKNIPVAKLLAAARVASLANIAAGDYQRAQDWITKATAQAPRT